MNIGRKSFFYNVTSPYHTGSEAATSIVFRIGRELSLDFNGDLQLNLGNLVSQRFSYPLNGRVISDGNKLNDIDLIVINGEGGVDNKRTCAVLKLAKKRNIDVWILNTIWPAKLSDEFRSCLSIVKKVVVRGLQSKDHFKNNVTSNISFLCMPDFSFFADSHSEYYVNYSNNVVFGDLYELDSRFLDFEEFAGKKNRLPMIPRLMSFAETVESLKTAKVYITGRHHGAYAAILAGIPFVCYSREGHKMLDIARFLQPDVDMDLIDYVFETNSIIEAAVNDTAKYHKAYERLKNDFKFDALLTFLRD